MQLVLPVVFLLEDGSHATRELVVDTGFTGGLSLPMQMVEELELPYFRRLEAELADGVMNEYLTYLAVIRWHDKMLEVVTYALGDRPLLGTALLEGSTLNVDFTESAKFTLEKS